MQKTTQKTSYSGFAKCSCIVLSFILSGILSVRAQEQIPANSPYKNPGLSIEQRVDDLLMRMTPEEKVGQLSTLLGWPMYTKTKNGVVASEVLKTAVATQNIGALWGTLRADPWTQKTLQTGLNPQLAAKATNAIQKIAVEESRLGIPLFLAEEAMHGHMAIGTTDFPAAIAQASTFNPDLNQKMGAAIAAELRAQGAHIGYGPILDLAREPRWSRVEETFGEDPYLIAEMGLGLIQGFQGSGIDQKDRVISTLKHFAAYGVSEGGHNGGAVHVGERELMQAYMYPFKKAIDNGALSVMTAYSSVDGIPSTAHKKLLTGLLREQWGFKGFVVSDLGSIEGIKNDHHAAATLEEAAALAMNAGVDVDLGGKGFDDALFSAFKAGDVSEERLNEAVKNVLRLKFEMGLFENPYVDEKLPAKVVRNREHTALAKEVALEGITLLKNEGNLLPLSKDLKKIAVIGPNADTMYNQLGDYTAPQDPEYIITPLEGIRAKWPNAQVTYVKGTAIRDTTQTDIPAAVAAAKEAEVAIVVLGGSSARDFKTEYLETGAASVSSKEDELLSDMESGEGYDRSTLDLMGKQLELLQAVAATGTPTVLVLITGRPLLINWPAKHIPAILDAWYPGSQGGHALAEVLIGDYNPAGRLPISIPRSVGQTPVYYNHWWPKRRDYVEESAAALYAFGHGLSYTKFEYSGLTISQSGNGKDTAFDVSVTVENTGDHDGDEVVQLYLRDEVSSVVTPVKQLRGFKRIHLAKGESKTLSFKITPEDLALYNVDMDFVAEAGSFEIQLGASSQDIRLTDTLTLTETIRIKN
ncbi:glycoside hydrolase family 3 N-terminal domain-containing protein [Leeuwenhoekiella nanhaiensis]|uniref:Beta-glucosidase n=1 Tax=Leeuwenhoekiella nanhaiensis TaxID=1655491 RepID=A0A2G1VPY6_9FLAO|nr:glycoside hydrolase family 3 N-terminal domain-containing protein [Leeuwenhoekiella nanhaiensis]PHQ28825.1 beta-glucosidase [Leeuwenhoekiella nanhaiensis]